MAVTPEGKVKDSIKKIIDKYPSAWYFMPIPAYHRGIPDFIGVYRGIFFAIEAKAGKGKLTALQRLVKTSISNTRGIYLVVNEENVADVDRMLHQIEVDTWPTKS